MMCAAEGVYPYGSVMSFPVLFDNLCNRQKDSWQ